MGSSQRSSSLWARFKAWWERTDRADDPWAVILKGPKPAVARFQSKEQAESFAEKMREKGYHPLVVNTRKLKRKIPKAKTR
jgi:hypothetical protein